MGLCKHCFGLTLVTLSAVVVLFAALEYDFDLVFEQFPEPLFMFVRYFEASDPRKPAPRNVMTSQRYQNCSEMMVHRAAANCGGRCKLVLVGDSITEAVSGEWCGVRGMVFPNRREAAFQRQLTLSCL